MKFPLNEQSYKTLYVVNEEQEKQFSAPLFCLKQHSSRQLKTSQSLVTQRCDSTAATELCLITLLFVKAEVEVMCTKA